MTYKSKMELEEIGCKARQIRGLTGVMLSASESCSKSVYESDCVWLLAELTNSLVQDIEMLIDESEV